jgi:hypothetical protein
VAFCAAVYGVITPATPAFIGTVCKVDGIGVYASSPPSAAKVVVGSDDLIVRESAPQKILGGVFCAVDDRYF